jgi:hypothetical protein
MEQAGRARGQARPANPKWAENGALGSFKKIIFIFFFKITAANPYFEHLRYIFTRWAKNKS